MTRRPRALLPCLATSIVLSACSGSGPADGEADAEGSAGGLQVIASFYPLEYLAQRVAGDHAEVTTLTSPGIDPHDVELTPRTVGSLGAADLVVYESGMQPAVDEAVATQAADRSFDVTPAADLIPFDEAQLETEGADDAHAGDGEEHSADADEHSADAEEHSAGADEDSAGTDEHSVDDGHDHGPADPHFWLDPQRYADVAVALADELSTVDPENTADYAANAQALVADLEQLDGELEEGLSECASREVVTTHDAFGYLGARYDLDVTGITGISPDSEPSPARLAEVAALVDRLGVTTVYAEPLLSPAIAETVANETGTQVLTLDPADGLTQAGEGSDYLEIMRGNLATLRDGQGCA